MRHYNSSEKKLTFSEKTKKRRQTQVTQKTEMKFVNKNVKPTENCNNLVKYFKWSLSAISALIKAK